MDRRLTPFSGRIGHISLQAQMPNVPLTAGEAARVAPALAWLLAAPAAARDRQLLQGDALTVIDHREGHAFVMVAKDGYCGWLAEADLAPPRSATHRVQTPSTHLYPAAKAQSGPPVPLYLNTRVSVISTSGAWAETPEGFIPANHLCPLDRFDTDPATVAERFLHAPYLWAGNAVAGIDCSGLVQLSHHACGLSCPADSDLQRSLGRALTAAEPMRRGDLLFWKGHVAMATSATEIIHANGYTMSVAVEPLAAAEARIIAQYGSGLLERRRVIEA